MLSKFIFINVDFLYDVGHQKLLKSVDFSRVIQNIEMGVLTFY